MIRGPRTTGDCPEVFLLSDPLPLLRTTSSGGVGLRDPILVGDGFDGPVLLFQGVGGTTVGVNGGDPITGGGTLWVPGGIGVFSPSGRGSLNIGRGMSSRSGGGSLNDGLFGCGVDTGGGGGTTGITGGGGGGGGGGATTGITGATTDEGCDTGFATTGTGGGGGGGIGSATGGSTIDWRGGGESASGDFLAKEGF